MDKSEDIENIEINKDVSIESDSATEEVAKDQPSQENEITPMEIEEAEENTENRELNEEELLKDDDERNRTSEENKSPTTHDLNKDNSDISKDENNDKLDEDSKDNDDINAPEEVMDVDQNSNEDINESSKENIDDSDKRANEDNIESGEDNLACTEEMNTNRNESPIDENSINSLLNQDENNSMLNQDETSKNSNINQDENSRNSNINQDENSKNSNINQDENTSFANQDETSRNSNINQDENDTNDVSSNKEPENSRDNLEELDENSKTNEPIAKPTSEASDEENHSEVGNDQRQEEEDEDDSQYQDPESIMNMCSTELIEGSEGDLTTEFVQVQLMDDDANDSNSLQQNSETNERASTSGKKPSQIDPLMNSSIVFAEIRTLNSSASETIIGDDEDEDEPSSNLKNVELVNRDEEEMCIVPDAMPAIIPIEDKSTTEDESTKAISEDKNTSESVGETSTKTIMIKPVEADPKQISKSKVSKDNSCHMCRQTKQSRFMIRVGNETRHLCDKACVDKFKKSVSKQQSFGSTMDFISQKDPEPRSKVSQPIPRNCACCRKEIVSENNNIYLCWETLEFCSENCLETYQKQLGGECSNCKGPVCEISLGKYCVRFGSDVKQFCSSVCLDEFKKGLKVCSYCQKDISKNKDGFLAPIGDKGQFKEFCSQNCMEEYERMSSNLPPPEITDECSVCYKKNTRIYKEIIDKDKTHMLCSEPCFAAFKFVNPIVIDKCVMCRKCFNRENTIEYKVCFNKSVQLYCSKTCMNVFILAYRKIICCDWCKVKKYNFDMIHYEKGSQKNFLCSLNCIKLYNVSISACTSQRMECNNCLKVSTANFHLAMSDATLRNFCSYECVQFFQTQFNRQTILSNLMQQGEPIPLGQPKRIIHPAKEPNFSISSVESLATAEKNAQESNLQMNKGHQPENQDFQLEASQRDSSGQTRDIQAQTTKHIVIIKPEPPKRRRNVATMCYPNSFVAETQTTSSLSSCDASTQTDGDKYNLNFPVPVPFPIYVPCPFFMFSLPYPHPLPFPLPIPVPIFLPTTRKSHKSIMKDIKRILERTPTDPYEADLIRMAEAVASEKETNSSESGDDDDDNDNVNEDVIDDVDEVVNDDVDEVVNDDIDEVVNDDVDEDVNDDDLNEDDEVPGEIVNSESDHDEIEQEEPGDNIHDDSDPDDPDEIDQNQLMEVENISLDNVNEDFDEELIDKKPNIQSVEEEEESDTVITEVSPETVIDQPLETAEEIYSREDETTDVQIDNISTRSRSRRGRRPRKNKPPEDTRESKPEESNKLRKINIKKEESDIQVFHKYSLGVAAFNLWINKKNQEIANSSTQSFKSELLQMRADELNYLLCLFIKEARNQNGLEFSPDTIYYLCLGIQQYLFENGRIDNIFTDLYFEQFTDDLDILAQKFINTFENSDQIVTRLEEEFLWESKQLGAYSPSVLLFSLIYFNTKYFNITTVDEHLNLAFSKINKHWKKPMTQIQIMATKTKNTHNILLRYYPSEEDNNRKGHKYEQHENEDNPMRCPVRLFEFYMSKCSESAKSRGTEVFYLLPERSCVPESPVWYSTESLPREPLAKMLNRVKMFREINDAIIKNNE